MQTLTVRRFAAALLLLAASVLSGMRCTASAVETQAVAADRVARALNTAAPVALDEADRAAQSAALDAARACMADIDAGTDCRARAHAVYDDTRAAWRRVFVAWDAVGAAHATWRAELTRCRAAHAATCTPGVDAAAGLLRTSTAWRCALRAVGRADLDPLPGALTCSDGGAA